ncbi:MAG TPA: hypothetical protein VGJ93_00365 [Desulfuromonadaceae bacterium]|jgi:predicted CXXCH cytochrome family protein
MGRPERCFLFFLNFSFFLICYSSADCTPLVGDNPHGNTGACSVCHIISADQLNNPSVPDSIKTKLKADPVALCQGCHGTGFGHGIGEKPVIKSTELPLGEDGSINCAVTCHQMHDPTVVTQKNFLLRLPSEKLCFSCHDK